MPGLSQLKQFEKDILSLGDEVTLRASRGEKPVKVPVPKNIKVDNDAEDFVLGMPEVPLVKKSTVVDDDLSDITGSGSKTTASSGEEEVVEQGGPDLSSLLAPVVDFSADSGEADAGMPDLSMFMDEPEPEVQEEEQPQEEVEISVADMGLDALLAGAGFDGTEGAAEDERPAAVNDDEFVSDFDNIVVEEEKPEEPAPEPVEEEPAATDSSSGGFEMPDELKAVLGMGQPEPETSPATDSFAIPDVPDFSEPAATDEFAIPDVPEIPDVPVTDDFSIPESTETPAASDFDDFSVPDDFNMPLDMDAPVQLEPPEEEGGVSTVKVPSGDDSFGLDSLPDFDVPATDDFGASDFTSEDSGPDEFTDNIPEGLYNPDDIELPSETPAATDDFGVSGDDFGSAGDDFGASGGDFESVSLDDIDSLPDVSFDNVPTGDDIPIDDIPSDDFSSGEAEGGADNFGDIFDTEGGSDQESFDYDSGPIETFDTSGMEDVDFGIPDTDTAMNPAAGPEEDFSFDGGDFEIPGFSDVETVQEPKKNQKPDAAKKLDVPDFSKGISGGELPPNTLSDEQYAKFLKNFNEYPLNVRLAFEDLIVQDEFTDDAEFEIIEKILNKAPARQIAAMLEKMLDTSIPVPRDYEHRTADEYEAYKKSIQYQLKNKILPGALIFMVLVLVSWGLFNFTKNCIYIPAKASKYYKQGYTLLQSDEYSQAQMKFDQAASYKMKKKWFFRYAREYREHKQYQRAADIYMKILHYFDHDKQAGIEYAQMELDPLANYSKAEEIVRRQVLDYHVNDADGLLLLGDIFLEWGTEKDPEKLDAAKDQYMNLMQLYKPNNLYNSRMMRYYIRSDNLQQVIGYQKMFESDEKSLGSDDWTELGGYLLEKMYGPLSPSEEQYRYQIEGLRALLQRAVKMDQENPVALYNLAKYYIHTNEIRYVEPTLNKAVDKFNKAPQLSHRDIYKFIDSYRLLGENYIKTNDYLQAQEQYTKGITLYTAEKENAGFVGNKNIGILYADLADINYLLAGDYDNAAVNYKNSVELGNDSPSIRYRLGYMSYKKKNYQEALGSFMKAGEGNIKQRNLLYSMANTLALRNDDYAAEGYYEQLISELDLEIQNAGGSVYPQTNADQYDLVDLYLYAANNYGVVLHRLAKRTGDSQKNAESIVQLQQSVRAWDALTRNQKTLLRLEGSNLASENIKYVTHPSPDFEPSIYIDIPKTLTDTERL
ncbi:MAG: hypothetical protein J5527_02625 [Treponema sp.]|nr:hypothetical protein [Treponema sp.]